MTSSRKLLPIVLAMILCSGTARGNAWDGAPERQLMKVLRSSDRTETVGEEAAFTSVHDSWTSFDKAQHTAFSFLSLLGSQYVLVNKAGWQEERGIPLSVGLTASLGVAKELYDWQHSPSRHFCWRDLAANLVGISAAVLLVLY